MPSASKLKSDPIAYQCSCSTDTSSPSKVLLFYNYTTLSSPQLLAQKLKEFSARRERGDIRGKIRIASEGYNITIGGRVNQDLTQLVCLLLDLQMDESVAVLPGIEKILLAEGLDRASCPLKVDNLISQALLCQNVKEAESLSVFGRFVYMFFKPSHGCSHVFANLSTKVLSMGLFDGIHSSSLNIPITSQTLISSLLEDQHDIITSTTSTSTSTSKVIPLTPAQFHEKLLSALDESDQSSKPLLIDVRNVYETKIGHFTSSILPPIRKYSLLPTYLASPSLPQQTHSTREIMTYCTGGIRCESAGPLLSLAAPQATVYTLQGGIQMYLDHVHSYNKPSLFKGANYVFDARQALLGPTLGVGSDASRDGNPNQVDEDHPAPPRYTLCSQCLVCGEDTYHYVKCRCFSIIVCCPSCAVSISTRRDSSSADADNVAIVDGEGCDDGDDTSVARVTLSDLVQSVLFCCKACKEGQRPCDCERERAIALGLTGLTNKDKIA